MLTLIKYLLIVSVIFHHAFCYAGTASTAMLSLSGDLQQSATVDVVVKKTTISTAGGAMPGLAGSSLVEDVALNLQCSKDMVLQLLAVSANTFKFTSLNNPKMIIPYVVTLGGSVNVRVYNNSTYAMAVVNCNGNSVQIPLNITTTSLPYGIEPGLYKDTMILNFSY